MNIQSIVLVVLLAAFAIPAQAQQLTESDIQAAIAAGPQERSGKVGLYFKGPGIGWGLRGMALSMFNDGKSGWEEFGMSLYTPETWIQVNAAMASEEFEQFTAKNVTADMTKPVLRVFTKPGHALVVIRSKDGSQVLRSTASAECTRAMPFNLEARPDCTESQFPLEGVREILAAGNGEFLVTVRVTGYGYNSQGVREEGNMQHDFQVKGKHLNDLPGLK